MKRLLLFICTLLCANVLLAQTEFIVGNLKYKVSSSNPTEVSVGKVDNTITTANIPETVTYNETTYSVTSIGDGAFYNCSSLSSITIPNSVASIGMDAFSYCSSLSSITIPNSVTSIGYWAFSNCSSLTSVTIPNSLTSIEEYVFQYCSSLTSITIPNSVTSIGNGAFWGCSSLTSVTIPNSVTSIGMYAFSDCSSLTSMTIPNGVDSIMDNAFSNCSSLTSVTIGENVTSIGNYAFNGCSSLQNVTCLATNPPILYNNSFPYPNMATLTVPCGTFEVYNSSDWNIFFADRIEEDCSGLEDVEETQLSFYPNPTKSEITFNETIESIEVIDLTGRCVLRFANASEINIETLPSGAYYLRLTNQDKAIIRKVIKE